MSSNISQVAKPYVRLAGHKDYEAIVEVFCRSFSNDPLVNYLAGKKSTSDVDNSSKSLRAYWHFCVNICVLVGGRVTVVVVPDSTGTGAEKIASSGLWYPPNIRASGWMTLVRAGILSVLWGWGLSGLRRNAVDYQGAKEDAMHKAFQERGIKIPIYNSWYLETVGTDPEFQKQGFMGLLIREAFEHAPNDMFTLEATTEAARDQYMRYRFESIASVRIAEGKADAQGIVATGASAVGLDIWGMVKLPEGVAEAR